MTQPETMSVAEIRCLMDQVSRDQTVSEETAQLARTSIQVICKEAFKSSKSRLSTADVLRALFRPVLEGQGSKGCSCSSCTKRHELKKIAGKVAARRPSDGDDPPDNRVPV